MAGEPQAAQSRLTPREAEVLALVASGLTNGEAARVLGVSVHAVKFHLTSVYRKLGVNNRTEAAVLYFQDSTFSGDRASVAAEDGAGSTPSSPGSSRPAGPLAVLQPDPLDLSTDHPRGLRSGFGSGRETVALPAALVSRLRGIAGGRSAELPQVLFAAFAALLSRRARQQEVVLGIAHQVGMRPSRLRAIQLGVDAETPFDELVAHVESASHTSSSLDGALPRPQVLVVFHETNGHPTSEGALPEGIDLALSVSVHAAGATVALDYDRDLFEGSTVERMVGHLTTMLESVAVDPTQPVGTLPLLTADERRRLLVEWNDTARPYPTCRTDELISGQAAASPDEIAVESGRDLLSYRELDQQANRLARLLQSLGVGTDVLVGICMGRSADMVVALLGVMKSGGAYVPIDPSFPAERQRFMLEDAAVRVLLTEESLLEGLPEHGAEIVCLDRDADRLKAESADAPRSATGPEDVAYVIYTSGSTGRPKGVRIPHRALVNFLTTMAERPQLEADDVLVAVTTLSFDIAGLELYLPLANGARVVVASQETAGDPRHLASLIERSGATVVQATPTTWRMLVDASWPGVPGLKALCGGEALPAALAERLLERNVQLWNMYGPTETTIWSTVRQVNTVDAPLTIGRPIANTSLFVLDERLQPVPVGVPGELHIGGHGVALGYLNRPELTAERFIPHPFDPDPEARLYKTGDLARYRENGEVEFLGRLDHQVKVRGFRIELGEIETALARHPGVEAAVVVPREDTPGDVRLVAYVIPSASPVTGNGLRRYLGESLPSYMVPSAIVALDEFPLTPNRKIDRKALPAPTSERPAEEGYVAPRTPLETKLVAIWEEVLGVRPIGVTDDFFDLGATSIVAAELFARIERELGSHLPLAPVFRAPTVEALATLLEEGSETQRWTSLVPIQANGSRPPIYCVHGGAGTILHLQPLSRRLGPDQPFYGLQARGLYGGAAPLQTVEEMARHYLTEVRSLQPHGPYYLAGYCFGAIVAFDMAHLLRADGEDVALLASFNGPSPLWLRKYRSIGGQPSRRAARAMRPPPPPLARRVVGVLTSRRKIQRWISHLTWRMRIKTLDPLRFKVSKALDRPLPERVREGYFLKLAARAEVAYEPSPYPGTLLVFSGEGLYDDRLLGWEGLAEEVVTFSVPGARKGNRQAMAEPYVEFVAEGLLERLSEIEQSWSSSAEPVAGRLG